MAANMSYTTLPSFFAVPPVNIAILNLKPIKSSKLPIYKCGLCPKEYIHKSSLSRHFLNHTGKKRFNCNICKKSFNRSDVLSQHRKTKTCIIRTRHYNIIGMHENEIKNTKFSDIFTSVDILPSIDERMCVPLLYTNTSGPFYDL
jgi:uncharacterized Zn-finger protein